MIFYPHQTKFDSTGYLFIQSVLLPIDFCFATVVSFRKNCFSPKSYFCFKKFKSLLTYMNINYPQVNSNGCGGT